MVATVGRRLDVTCDVDDGRPLVHIPRMRGTALIVDPDSEFARRLAAVAEDLGLQAEVVRSGDAAATKLVNKAYDVVITELSLPGLDGFALIKALRARYSRTQTRVVVVSPFVEQRTLASKSKDALGIDAVIARNGPIEAALRTLRRCLTNALVEPRASATAATLPARATPLPAHAPQRDIDLDDLEVTDGSDDDVEVVDAVKDAREHERLQAVADAGGDDGAPPDPELQNLVSGVAREFGVETALVSFMLADRQWFKAYSGIDGQLLAARGLSRELTFCQHIIDADQPKMMVVADAAVHPAFMKNPAVISGLVRSYVGAPLITSSGQVLGTLCLVDKRPSRVTPHDMDRLTLATRHIAGLIEMRTAERRSQQLETQLESLVQDSHRVALRWMAVLDHLDVGIVLMNDADRTIIYANDAVASVFGLTPDDLRGLTREQFIAGAANLSADENEFRRTLAAPPSGPFAGNAVIELVRPQRRLLRWTSQPVRVEGATLQMATFTDVTAENDLAQTREVEARIDLLTGLVNRRGFVAEAAREVARSRRNKAPLWVAMFDLDNFKAHNDSHGHAAGDHTLVAVAAVLRKSLRSIDVIARRGGDEFVALIGECDQRNAMIAAERVRDGVAGLRLPSGAVTVSGGVAVVEAFDVEAAIAVADGRLYEAKRAGRNCVVGPSTVSAVQTTSG